MYILVQKGQNDPYHVPGQKRARLMKEYLISDRCADLAFLMTGGLKPEYYNREIIFNFFDFCPRYITKKRPIPYPPLPIYSDKYFAAMTI